MSAREVFVQQFARLFHHYHYRKALSPEKGSATEPQLESWNALPCDERNRLVAAASLAILELGRLHLRQTQPQIDRSQPMTRTARVPNMPS